MVTEALGATSLQQGECVLRKENSLRQNHREQQHKGIGQGIVAHKGK